MEDYPKITCSECKDLVFARNLARQMREGQYGRHNSNRGDGNAPTPERIASSNFRFRTRTEIGPESVLGRFQAGSIRGWMYQCAVGDTVLCDDPDPPNKIFTFQPRHDWTSFSDYEAWAEPQVFRQHERWLFEHVRLRVTPDDGLTWQDQYLWKRIE